MTVSEKQELRKLNCCNITYIHFEQIYRIEDLQKQVSHKKFDVPKSDTKTKKISKLNGRGDQNNK